MEPARTTPSWLAQRAAQTPHTAALVGDEGSFTYADLLFEARRRAAALASLAPKGTGEPRIALLAGNCAEHALWIMGALEAGVQFVTLNTRLSTSELLEQVKDAQPAALLHDKTRAAAAQALASQADAPLRVLCFEEARALLADKPSLHKEGDGAYDLDRVSNIMYTSGSTGRPKGVMQTLGNHWHSAHNCRSNLGFSATRDVWGCPTPLFHTSGLSILMRSLACGVGVRLYGRFDAARVNDDVLAGRVSCLSAVTFQIERMLDDLQERGLGPYPSTLRFTLQGGGPLSLETLERCRIANMGVVQSFGMTETASQVVALSPQDAPLKAGSSGRALGGVQLRIAPQNGSSSDELPPGTTGRILLKSPTLAIGYLNQSERYEASFTPDGWFDTGDLGHKDSEGYLYVTCRRSDLIISGGENVYPAEVEAAIARHPDVAGVVVAGVDDPVWGSVAAALCVPSRARAPQDPALAGIEELRAFCRERLAGYKCPRHLVWTRELPLTATGKPQRTKAASIIGAALGLNSGA